MKYKTKCPPLLPVLDKFSLEYLTAFVYKMYFCLYSNTTNKAIKFQTLQIRVV